MTNVWYVKNVSANCDGNLYFSILHLPRVELHCKLQELHRVTGPLAQPAWSGRLVGPFGQDRLSRFCFVATFLDSISCKCKEIDGYYEIIILST